MPQHRKKEESEGLRGEIDQIKFIDLGFERWQLVRSRKARGRQDFFDRFCGSGRNLIPHGKKKISAHYWTFS